MAYNRTSRFYEKVITTSDPAGCLDNQMQELRNQRQKLMWL